MTARDHGFSFRHYLNTLAAEILSSPNPPPKKDMDILVIGRGIFLKNFLPFISLSLLARGDLCKTIVICHFDPFASVIPSEARNLSIYVQGRLQEKS